MAAFSGNRGDEFLKAISGRVKVFDGLVVLDVDGCEISHVFYCLEGNVDL